MGETRRAGKPALPPLLAVSWRPVLIRCYALLQLFLEEERERELEAIYDANAERDRERNELRATRDGGATGPEVSAVEKTTTETLMAGEKIMEALDISEEDRRGADAYEESKTSMTDESIAKMAPRQRNPIFSIYPSYIDPEVHVLKVVQKIPPASLNDALLVLPFAKVVSMLKHLDFWAQHVREACPAGLSVPVLTSPCYSYQTHRNCTLPSRRVSCSSFLRFTTRRSWLPVSCAQLYCSSRLTCRARSKGKRCALIEGVQ